MTFCEERINLELIRFCTHELPLFLSMALLVVFIVCQGCVEAGVACSSSDKNGHQNLLADIQRFTIMLLNELMAYSFLKGLGKGNRWHKAYVINGSVVDGICTKLFDPNRTDR